FTGHTAADTMIAVLTKDPPNLDTSRHSISPALDRIVGRCLEKSPDLRFQSATDLAFALESLSTVSTTSSPKVDAVARVRRARAPWLTWTVAALAIVLSALSRWLEAGAKPEPNWHYCVG